MLPLIPVLLGMSLGLTSGLFVTRKRKPEGMTPERQKIYEAALSNLKDANGLDKLADAFGKEGLTDQANLLKKRALLRRLSPVEKENNRKRLKEGFTLTDPVEVLKIASEFEEKGCTGAAFRLKQYAKGLQGE